MRTPTTRAPTWLSLIAVAFTGCSAEAPPAFADGLLDRLPPDPGRLAPLRPLTPPRARPQLASKWDRLPGKHYSSMDLKAGYLPVPSGFVRFGGGLAFDYAGAAAARNGNNGGNGGGNQGCGNGNGGPSGGKDCEGGPNPKPDPVPPTSDVPGPLSLLLLVGAFTWSRRLRRRIKRG